MIGKAQDHSPVYGFLSNPSMVDFPSRMAAVFFVSGCSFRCGFCHNPDLIHRQENHLSWRALEDAGRRFAEDWVDAAVITGGEPTCSRELPRLIRFLKQKFGWAVKLDTNGSHPDVLNECLPLVDYVAMDIKSSPSTYAELTGWDRVDSIMQSIRLITTDATDYEFRTTVIDDVHDDTEMHEIGRAVRGARRFAVQPFLPKDNLPDPAYRQMPRTSSDRLMRVREIMSDYVAETVVRG
jgi:pyruvate formate lyase activating enzyme